MAGRGIVAVALAALRTRTVRTVDATLIIGLVLAATPRPVIGTACRRIIRRLFGFVPRRAFAATPLMYDAVEIIGAVRETPALVVTGSAVSMFRLIVAERFAVVVTLVVGV